MARTKFRGYISPEFLENACKQARETRREVSICESVKSPKDFYTLFTDLGNNEEAILIITPEP